MTEQKIVVKLDPAQVMDLKEFVRTEIARERQANMRVSPPTIIGAEKPVIWDSPHTGNVRHQKLCVDSQRMPHWHPAGEPLPDGWLQVFTR